MNPAPAPKPTAKPDHAPKHRKPAAKRRVHMFRIMMTRDELSTLGQAAKLLDLPVSTWARVVIMDKAKGLLRKNDAAAE